MVSIFHYTDFYFCVADNHTIQFNLGTDCNEQPAEKLNNNCYVNRRLSDINEIELFNIESLQSACSTVDMITTKSKCNALKSKSQEELTQKMKRQKENKKAHRASGGLQHQVTEWLEIHNDKVQAKLLSDKMKKLAEKLKKPGGEEKLRTRIEKYLTPEQSLDGEDNKEFKKQLSNEIIRKLKKIYLTPQDNNVNVYRMESSKYCCKSKIDNFTKAVLNWTKNLKIKTKDFLGRNVKKDDVFKYVCDKLEPIILDRPQSDTEYKESLKSNITEIINELPLETNKEFYLNEITEKLVNDIFDSESKLCSTYIQPTTKEIKQFINDELKFFFEKCHVAVSAKRKEHLEIELLDLVLDLEDITDIDSYLVDYVTILFKKIGKVPEYKAKYFTNLLLKDYKEFFFSDKFFHLKSEIFNGRPEFSFKSQAANDLVDSSFETYRQQLEEEINKWISKLNVPTYDKDLEVLSKDLANDIMDRYKYFLSHPSNKGSGTEELEHLKSMIFKWTNQLVGEENTSVLAIQDLMNEINKIPKPSLQNNSVAYTPPHNIDTTNNSNKSYVDQLIEQVYNWCSDLNNDLHISQDSTQNKLLIKEFAEEIEKGVQKNEDGFIDKVVDVWTAKVFNDKLSHHEVKQLKNKISNIPSTNRDRVNDPKQEKVLIRAYEDLVDEWIDTIPIAPEKQELFFNNKNEIVHAIAVKIFKIQTKSKYLPAEALEKKLQEELSYWLEKLPLHGKVDNQFDRDKLATNLVKSIHIHNILNSLENQPMPRIDEIGVNQVKNVILEGIQRKPIEQEKSVEKEKQEETATKELAHKPNGTLGDKNAIIIDEDIIERIKKLDPKLDDKQVKNMACELTLYLQNLDQFEQRKQLERENNFLVDTIEVWLKGLPLHVADVNQFKKQITDFVKSIKQLISSGSDIAAMKKKILIFTRSLPIRHLKKYDLRFLNEQVSKLMQSLNIFPDDDEPNELQTKTNKIVHDTVKDWIATLPLKAVHCPAELRALTNDISSVITFVLLNPEHNLTHQNEMILLEEIVHFLRRFPLIHEMSTESHISRMARELLNSLKNLNINLFRNENFAPLNNVTVYDVSLQKTNATDDSSIQSVKENDINNNAAAYTEQLVKQISEWLNCLNLPIGNKQGFKEVVINDLAGDIVDRRKYLELNPNNIGTEEDELEHLKYQIFKWINKLVGEENLKTIEHAEELMRRINQIPVPMLVRPQDKGQAAQSLLNQCCQEYIESQRNKSQNINSPRRMSGVRQVAVRFGGSPPAPEATSNHSPDDIQNPVPCCSQDPPPKPPPPEEGTKKALFEKYMKIFSDACASLAIDDPSPLRDLAKTAIYNGILKTFFNLKSNPDIENDYEYFEFILEESLDNFLDVLPQTEEFIRQRHAWKANILEHAINFLEELHKFEDAPSFRQLLRNKFNRKFAIKHELEHCFQLQQGFLSKMADAYILETNYKEKDPVKANIYRNRLMKRVDELANHLSKEHNVGFRFFNPPQLHRLAMKVLEEVPIPTDTILQDEVEEIQLTDEVEKWYKELPTQPARTENEVVLRKRFFELLAKKLHDIHKRVPDEDPSKEAKMKHEVSQFLEKRADLQRDEDLNINFMVDQLHNRIKNRWLQVPGEYDEFAKFKPFSSSFAHVDDAEFLAPLIEASPRQAQESGQRTLVDPEYFIQPGQPMQSIGPGRMSHGTGVNGTTANRTRMSQGGPSQGYASQQGMRASAPPRSLQGSRLTTQSPRQNLSLPAGRAGQASVVRQIPQSPRNGRAALHSSLPNQRAQNINRSLRQVDQVRGSSRSDAQGQLFVPGRTRQSRSPSPGAAGSRGPTPSQGIGTTAEAETAPDSSDEEMLDAGHHVKCKCLEVMRRRMRNYYDFPCIHRYR